MEWSCIGIIFVAASIVAHLRSLQRRDPDFAREAKHPLSE
jgi:hypothetical protein